MRLLSAIGLETLIFDAFPKFESERHKREREREREIEREREREREGV
jgi:hypothetical protein